MMLDEVAEAEEVRFREGRMIQCSNREENVFAKRLLVLRKNLISCRRRSAMKPCSLLRQSTEGNLKLSSLSG